MICLINKNVINMRNLILHHLEAIIESGSVIGACRRLFLSQPALSQYIKRLEAEYGIVIFESSERLNINSELYVQNSGLKEIKYKDKYLYIIDSFKKLKAAQRKLDDVMKRYKDAYIVKIDFI